MGLFDSWRRKKPTTTVKTRPREVKKDASKASGDSGATPSMESIDTLLGEYNRLAERRDVLSVEREELTSKLERGEIEATQFRKELMLRIQEASRVSESLRETTAKLSELGYRGTLQ